MGVKRYELDEAQWVRIAPLLPGKASDPGRTATLSDLRNHDLIAIEDETGPHRGWGIKGAQGSERTSRLSVNHVDTAISAAVAGLGIVRTLSYQIADHIAAGRLQRVLADEPAPKLPISLLFQSGRKDRPNIRAFAELARRRLNGAVL
jgi:DNA-binding transcriptional LysR family regulator